MALRRASFAPSFLYGVLSIIYCAINHQSVNGSKIQLICPAGEGQFEYDSTAYSSDHSPCGMQAIQTCDTRGCDQDKWIGTENIDHCSGPIPKYFAPACAGVLWIDKVVIFGLGQIYSQYALIVKRSV